MGQHQTEGRGMQTQPPDRWKNVHRRLHLCGPAISVLIVQAYLVCEVSYGWVIVTMSLIDWGLEERK